MIASTVERARGRWHEILPQLGIETRFLVNKHGPCPLCGGKDRFRFDDKEGDGGYYCNQCGPGSGLVLIRKLRNWDHATACRAVDEIIGLSPPLLRRPPQQRPQTTDDSLKQMLANATDRQLVESYLAGRGLSIFPAVLKGHPGLPYNDDGRFLGRFSAMLAPVLAPDGTLRSVHRTYLADVPIRKKLASPVGTGGAIRLFSPTVDLGVSEGIETALAAHEIFAVPAWATISTSIMTSFTPPPDVRRLLIFADNDANFAGQKAAYTLANRLARDRSDLAIDVLVPPEPESDWLDALNHATKARAA
jgi:putative DNA primase/helicase